VGLVIFVLLWFQPQKLFLSKTVNEPVLGIIETAPAEEANRNPTVGQSPPGLQVARTWAPGSASKTNQARAQGHRQAAPGDAAAILRW
jgi:hypothetical protein